MASNKILELDSSNFAATVAGDKPVLVDFWAAWCGPCRLVAPVLDELAEERAGDVQIAKVDIDANQDLAFEYGVQSIPSFLLFQNGKVVDRIMGAMPKSAFENFLNRHVAAA